MLVTLIGRGGIYKLQLPEVVNGNYWLSDKTSANERKLINIEEKNGKWQIVSNNYARIVNPSCIQINNDQIKILNNNNQILSRIILQENGVYGIILDNTNEFCLLYCSPSYEDNIIPLGINKDIDEIVIGSGKDNDITYNNKLVSQKHARLIIKNEEWVIENYDKKFGTFVNNVLLEDEKVLNNGDVIFIMGLRIIKVGNNIYINNPLNSILVNLNKFYKPKRNEKITTEKIQEDDNSELYSEKDYFFRSPRITSKIERERVRIDAPPQIQDKEDMPILLALGASMTMGLMMVLSMSSSISAIVKGEAELGDALFSIFLSLLMIVGIIVFPILTIKYERNRKVKYENKRQDRYKRYLNTKINTINKIMQKQRKILLENLVSPEECNNIIINKTGRLWERKIEDHDFLSIRLGTGDLPLDIDIQYPEERVCYGR